MSPDLVVMPARRCGLATLGGTSTRQLSRDPSDRFAVVGEPGEDMTDPAGLVLVDADPLLRLWAATGRLYPVGVEVIGSVAVGEVTGGSVIQDTPELAPVDPPTEFSDRGAVVELHDLDAQVPALLRGIDPLAGRDESPVGEDQVGDQRGCGIGRLNLDWSSTARMPISPRPIILRSCSNWGRSVLVPDTAWSCITSK